MKRRFCSIQIQKFLKPTITRKHELLLIVFYLRCNETRFWGGIWNYKTLTPWKESYDQPRYHIQKQSHYLANKSPSSQCYGFSCGHVWMWELDCAEGWELKNWWFWTVVLEKTLETPLDCKETQPVHPKGDQPWDFFFFYYLILFIFLNFILFLNFT